MDEWFAFAILLIAWGFHDCISTYLLAKARWYNIIFDKVQSVGTTNIVVNNEGEKI
jgi:hypothetical protein